MVDLPPSQSSIDALNTATANLADLPKRTSTYKRTFTHEGNYLVHSYITLLDLFMFILEEFNLKKILEPLV